MIYMTIVKIEANGADFLSKSVDTFIPREIHSWRFGGGSGSSCFLSTCTPKVILKDKKHLLVYDNTSQSRKKKLLMMEDRSNDRSNVPANTMKSDSLTSLSRRSLLLLPCFLFCSNPSFAFATEKIEEINIEDSRSNQRKPWAPTEALLPATRVRLLLNQAISITEELASWQESSSDIKKSQNDLSQQQYDDTKKILSRLESILAPPLTLSDIKPNKSIRLAFDTYTAYLRYDDTFIITAPPSEKKKMIREDRIPDVKQVISADLDLRDLYRNEVITNVDEARAELRYQINQFERNNAFDCEEIRRLLESAKDACDCWFNLIAEEDVKEAEHIIKETQQS